MKIVGMMMVIAGTAQLAYAGDWGSDEQAKACEKETADSKSWGDLHDFPYGINARMKNGGVGAACKAEVERRGKICLADSNMKSIYESPGNANPHKDPNAFCNYRAFGQIIDQLRNAASAEAAKKAQAEAEANAKAKKEADAKAALEATEVPEVGLKNAALEKAVATAFEKDYSGYKALKVYLDRWVDDDLEKDDFGRVIGRDLSATVLFKEDGKCMLHYELWLQHGKGKSFSGPLSARGGGSMREHEILCSKVEASAGGGKAKKK